MWLHPMGLVFFMPPIYSVFHTNVWSTVGWPSSLSFSSEMGLLPPLVRW